MVGDTLTMTDCHVSMKTNQTPHEIVRGADVTIVGTVFQDCDADALVTSSASLVMDSCRFISSDRGSCVSVTGPVVIQNSLFSGNTPGGTRSMVSSGGPLTVASSDVVFNNGKTFNSTNVQRALHNTILWGNRDGTATDIQNQQLGSFAQFSPSIDSCIVEGWMGSLPGSNTTGADPEFLDLLGPDYAPGTGDEDYRLSVFSPAIDVGNAPLLPLDGADLDGDANVTEPTPFDLDGNTRVVATPMYAGPDPALALDIGAYEYQADCNGNGAFDLDDIDLGTSTDCNDNLSFSSMEHESIACPADEGTLSRVSQLADGFGSTIGKRPSRACDQPMPLAPRLVETSHRSVDPIADDCK